MPRWRFFMKRWNQRTDKIFGVENHSIARENLKLQKLQASGGNTIEHLKAELLVKNLRKS
jgi:hypothetical protein